MNQNIQSKIKDKIQEDISPTRNLTGIHLKIVFSIAILWTFFQLWYASPFPFWFNFGMFKGLPARAIHLGFALTLAFLIFPAVRGKKISVIDSFCDNRGGERIGKYIRDVQKSFDEGLSSRESLKNANKNYAHKWGENQIVKQGI